MKMRPFYKVPYEEWLFKNHPYVKEGHPEEEIRQWVLRELIDTYGYPREWINDNVPYTGRITVEEPVQIGSSSLRADIAIKNELPRLLPIEHARVNEVVSRNLEINARA